MVRPKGRLRRGGSCARGAVHELGQADQLGVAGDLHDRAVEVGIRLATPPLAVNGVEGRPRIAARSRSCGRSGANGSIAKRASEMISCASV